jgi:hypothetical protein
MGLHRYGQRYTIYLLWCGLQISNNRKPKNAQLPDAQAYVDYGNSRFSQRLNAKGRSFAKNTIPQAGKTVLKLHKPLLDAQLSTSRRSLWTEDYSTGLNLVRTGTVQWRQCSGGSARALSLPSYHLEKVTPLPQFHLFPRWHL